MKTRLHSLRVFIILLLMFSFSRKSVAQCTITGTTVNASSYSSNTCALLTSCNGVLYIGDGTSMTLKMDDNLDFSCLGAIRFIVKKGANIDFSTGNYNLQLAQGSSIEVEQGGQLGAPTNCSASDLIKIGADKIASCNGGGAQMNFPTLVENGGYSPISASASPSSFCNSGNSTITASASGANMYKWYDSVSGGTMLQSSSSTTYSTGTISSTAIYYVEAVYSTYTTVRKSVTVTVTDLPIAYIVTGTGSYCAGGTGVAVGLSNSTSGVNYQLQLGGVNTGAAVVGTGSAISFGLQTIAGTYTVIATNATTTCTMGMTGSAVITVNALPTTPTVATTQPTCSVSTGVITVKVQTVGETYSFDNGNTFQTSNVKSGLTSGSYNVIIKSIGGCTSLPYVNVINAFVPVNKTWNGSSWSPSVPTSNDKIIFSGVYTSIGDLTACSCQVASGSVVINSGHTMTITNEVTVTSGSLTFEESASLVQINDAAINSGNIIYKRNMTTNLETDYTYWSSPVVNQKLIDISPKTPTNYFYTFDALADDWINANSNGSMLFGIGYIIRGQHYTGAPPPGLPTTIFTGVPNNGANTIAIGANSSYLLGNPYPSALDADTFLNYNAGVLNGTLYFWTHSSAIRLATEITNGSAGSGAYAYTSDDYATYNATGGVAVTQLYIDPITGKPYPSSINPILTGKIASGQGFFASTKSSPSVYNIVFDNSMRVGVNGITGNNSQFFKTANTKGKTTISIEKDRIWLDLSNSQGAFKQTLVGYITGATNDYDSRFDGESFDGNEFVDFYSVNKDKNLTIQGRALPFDESDEVPLGFRSSIDGDFTINIDQVDGVFMDQSVFIIDKLTNTISDLKKGNYAFTTLAGTFNDRFVLSYVNGDNLKTLATSNFDAKTNQVLVSSKNKQIKVSSLSKTIDIVSIYDLSGRLIFQKSNVNNNELSVANLVSSHQTLVVKTSLENGEIVTDKIIF